MDPRRLFLSRSPVTSLFHPSSYISVPLFFYFPEALTEFKSLFSKHFHGHILRVSAATVAAPSVFLFDSSFWIKLCITEHSRTLGPLLLCHWIDFAKLPHSVIWIQMPWLPISPYDLSLNLQTRKYMCLFHISIWSSNVISKKMAEREIPIFTLKLFPVLNHAHLIIQNKSYLSTITKCLLYASAILLAL